MLLAIRLAARNIAEGTGGPFGACVFDRETHQLVAAGVNVVVPCHCSVAHAEAMAIMLAQQLRGSFDLARAGDPQVELFTSAQPCIQCFGILWWSGVRRLVVGARSTDVEELTGFEEGLLLDDWQQQLMHRSPLPPVEVRMDCLRHEACEPLRHYRDSGGLIYNPGSCRSSANGENDNV
jgi:tRNA(Arg) A34 adenosine deaminase TadA